MNNQSLLTMPSMAQWSLWLEAMTHHADAEIAQKRQEFGRAEQLSKQAEALCSSSGYTDYLPPIRFRLAMSLFQQGQLEVAWRIWHTLLNQAEGMTSRLIGECQLAIARLELGEGRYATAELKAEGAKTTFVQGRVHDRIWEANKLLAMIHKQWGKHGRTKSLKNTRPGSTPPVPSPAGTTIPI